MSITLRPGRDDDAPSHDLWEARVKSSLVQPLQEANGWLDQWHPNRPFDNTLLARNPGRSQSLSRLGPDGGEAAFLEGAEARIARWGAEFAAHPDIRRHVRDPARAWREVFRRNDAGMEYLVERLAPVCNPRLKLAQVENQIALLRDSLRRRLGEWHAGDDLEAELDKRQAALAPAVAAAPRAVAASEAQEAELPDQVPEASPRTREQKRFGRYDKDKDGAITRDEYLQSRRKAYAKLDANRDGVLSFDEWATKTTAKFATADLIGLPWRLVVGPKALAAGQVEPKELSGGAAETLSPEAALNAIFG